jgi:hypothetical protein
MSVRAMENLILFKQWKRPCRERSNQLNPTYSMPRIMKKSLPNQIVLLGLMIQHMICQCPLRREQPTTWREINIDRNHLHLMYHLELEVEATSKNSREMRYHRIHPKKI